VRDCVRCGRPYVQHGAPTGEDDATRFQATTLSVTPRARACVHCIIRRTCGWFRTYSYSSPAAPARPSSSAARCTTTPRRARSCEAGERETRELGP
jgi:hypothetical protein